MTQQPPPPYGYPPPPPPGFPPPPGYGTVPGGYGGPAAKTSGVAIASLVVGLLSFCAPVIGGLVAMLLGAIGLGTTGKPNVKGRGLAIAGLLLGLLSVLLWGGAGVKGYGMFAASAPDRALARKFLTDVSAGNTTAATADCAPGTSPADIQKAIDDAKSFGTLADATLYGIEVNDSRRGRIAFAAGQAVFGSTPRPVSFTFTAGPSGKRLIESWQLGTTGRARSRPAPTTTPASGDD